MVSLYQFLHIYMNFYLSNKLFFAVKNTPSESKIQIASMGLKMEGRL